MKRIHPLTSPTACSGMPRGIRHWLLAGAAALVIAIPSAVHSGWFDAEPPPPISITASTEASGGGARFADFGTEAVSADTRHVADWIADSRDSADFDFIIIDKKSARIYVFDGNAHLLASSPVLLGAAHGDDAVPGIGSRPIAQVRPEERTTHAGRFIAERGRNTNGEDVVWVDYDAAVSMHRVRNTNAKDHRLERLATPTIADNRISYGCINIPVAFYESHIRPIFAIRDAVVYVLPEIKSVQQVFGSYDVASAHGRAFAGSRDFRNLLP